MEKEFSDERLVLSIETSTKQGSLAILNAGRAVVAEKLGVGEIASEVLLSRVAEVLDRSGFSARDLDLIVVGTGPGSLTGVRIGISMAKGLAKGLGIACVGVGVMEALAVVGTAEPGRTFSIVPAGKSEYYWKFMNGTEDLAVVKGTWDEFVRAVADIRDVNLITTSDGLSRIPLSERVSVIENIAVPAGRIGLQKKAGPADLRPQYAGEFKFAEAEVAG